MVRTLMLLAVLPLAAPAATVILAPNAPMEDRGGAYDLCRIWSESTGQPATLSTVAGVADPGPSIYLGVAAATAGAVPLPQTADEDAFRITINPATRQIFLFGGNELATRFAVSWFCTRYLHANWFMPGRIGEVVMPASAELPATDVVITPAFTSRDLAYVHSADEREWARHNFLHARWTHGHAMTTVFPSSLFATHPDWFPILEGKRYQPIGGDYNWQPDYTNPAVVRRTADYVEQYFKGHPSEPAVSLCENDSICFDQSPATIAARGPLRYFRGRPDYSDVVFQFMNQVSDDLKRQPGLEGKMLSAYAYYWAEQTPRFSVRANILPWLTADRTQWYDPAFRAEDEALIRRWCRSGAAHVAVYDYLEGQPFLVPREPVHLIADSIQFEYATGVRGYYGEGTPNWAFDMPKIWLAAQLLTDPSQDPDRLLHTFYTSFFGPAAAPMESFYQECERAWLNQAGKARWIKFYNDSDQLSLFPPAELHRLRADLKKAEAAATVAGVVDPGSRAQRARLQEGSAARSNIFAERVRLVSNALRVTERWSDLQLHDTPATLDAFQAALLLAQSTNSIATFDVSMYTRVNSPAPILPANLHWHPAGIQDPSWTSLSSPTHLTDTTFNWCPTPTPWTARGEPYEGRTIQVHRTSSGAATVRYQHAAGERLSEWLPATPNAYYHATASFRGRVSPSNEEYLMMSFLDAQNHYVGSAPESRVPDGGHSRPFPLSMTVQAPPTAVKVGIALYAFHQSDGDWSEFTPPTLELATN